MSQNTGEKINFSARGPSHSTKKGILLCNMQCLLCKHNSIQLLNQFRLYSYNDYIFVQQPCVHANLFFSSSIVVTPTYKSSLLGVIKWNSQSFFFIYKSNNFSHQLSALNITQTPFLLI